MTKDAGVPQRCPTCGSENRDEPERKECAFACPPENWRWVKDEFLNLTDFVVCDDPWHDAGVPSSPRKTVKQVAEEKGVQLVQQRERRNWQSAGDLEPGAPPKPSPTEEELFQEWQKKQPSCFGYPSCDGNLTGIGHEWNCPLAGIPNSAGRQSMFTHFDAWQAGRESVGAPLEKSLDDSLTASAKEISERIFATFVDAEVVFTTTGLAEVIRKILLKHFGRTPETCTWLRSLEKELIEALTAVANYFWSTEIPTGLSKEGEVQKLVEAVLAKAREGHNAT